MGASALSLLQTRLELISIEWQEERERGKDVLVLAVIGTLLLAFGLLVATFFVIAVFWDSWRLTAIAIVALSYLGIGGWVLAKVRRQLRNRPKPFEATLQEFANDMAMLRRESAAAGDSAPDIEPDGEQETPRE